MKKLTVLIMAIFLLSGCGGLKFDTPYSSISTDNTSQIFVYTDSDVLIKEGVAKSDDTTVIVVGVKDDANVESVFNNAMDRVKDIFETRAEVYKSWIKGE